VAAARGDPARDPIDVARLFAGFTGAAAPFRAAASAALPTPTSLLPTTARSPENVDSGPAHWEEKATDAGN
jgi:hypothetical protein